MKILKITVACVLLCAIFAGGELFSALAQEISTPNIPSETNSFVESVLVGETDQDAPFFEEVLPVIAANIDENNKHSVTPYYDNLPRVKNPENFQGLGSTSYANINGKTVYAEAFYRLPNEGLNDPNCGMGLLIYQCIQYKLKHPEEDVKIGYSSYRTSATAAVCVIPDSKYYGYMRSLYGTNYDEQGFVRISYMLVEAARMGIEVTMINQLPSYGVSQYDPEKDELRKRSHIDYRDYFNAALKTDCYDKYAEGKKVSDFLAFTAVDWTVSDQTQNMQHMKSAIVSHYLATDGTEYSPGVFFSSANFDENNYRGANGNNNSQSGVIISNHDDLFRVTYNYMKLMEKYSYKEGIQELRLIMNKTNEEQIALIQSGRGNEIAPDEQLVYMGTENDPIFELYFTPIGGAPDTWDIVHNPISKHMNNFAASDDYVEFVWIHTEYARPYTGTVIEQILINKYCNDRDPKNKIVTKASALQIDPIKELDEGIDIGFKSIGNGEATHSKDLMMSYSKEGKRHYVSIMTSCNYYMIAFNHRTNSILVINETDETGNGFYKAFGSRYAYGMLGQYTPPPTVTGPDDDNTQDTTQSNNVNSPSNEGANTENKYYHIDEDQNNICDGCGADLSVPGAPVPPDKFHSIETPNGEADSSLDDVDSDTKVMIVIAISIAVALAIGGIVCVILVLIKKKRKLNVSFDNTEE